jgi:Flp pilus assembly protein TadG
MDKSLRESGSLTVFVAVMSLALFVMIGLVVDGGSALAADRSAYSVAEQAARAGAGQISVSQLRSKGVVALNNSKAVSAAVSYAAAAGLPATAYVSGNTVVVDISYSRPTAIISLIGIDSLRITATASAQNVEGAGGG